MKCTLTLSSECFVFTLLPNNMQTARYGIVIIPVIYVGHFSDFLWAEGFGDPILVGDEISRTHPDRPRGPPRAGLDTRSFTGVKPPGRGFYHPPPSSAEVKERVKLYTTPPLELRGLLWGEFCFYHSFKCTLEFHSHRFFWRGVDESNVLFGERVINRLRKMHKGNSLYLSPNIITAKKLKRMAWTRSTHE